MDYLSKDIASRSYIWILMVTAWLIPNCCMLLFHSVVIVTFRWCLLSYTKFSWNVDIIEKHNQIEMSLLSRNSTKAMLNVMEDGSSSFKVYRKQRLLVISSLEMKYFKVLNWFQIEWTLSVESQSVVVVILEPVLDPVLSGLHVLLAGTFWLSQSSSPHATW